ncbi:MAG: 30S ribosomal protein S12 methylthiotransferase RimO [Bacillota bacterium]|nr:30S ribosomal protein S12 methylthiotransferase RimO [Bacillota bacterium]
MKKIYIESLGCPKNTVDTENVLGLIDEGFSYSDEPEMADYIIVNTCAFIHDAESESYAYVKQYADYRRDNPDLRVIVMGCLAQSQTERMLNEYGVDAVLGTGSFHRVLDVLARLEKGERFFAVKDSIDTVFPILPRVVTTPEHFAYLKIAEGCDNRCTYCMIPSLRGKFRSRSIEEIVEEAMALDVEEVILIAQDTSRYGVDLYGTPSLGALLERLNEVPGIRWIRVHYLYPDILSKELIETFFRLEKVVKYFDIPVQHVSDRILKLMNRRTSRRDIERVFQTIRGMEPIYGEASIRTTFIVGFPGETEEDFEQLLDFVDHHQINRLGVFTYSDMPNIPSYKLPNKVSQDVMDERRDRVMLMQQDKSFELMETFIGSVVEAVVEEYIEDEDLYVCRTVWDAPEVDGELYVYAGVELCIGDFIRVKVTGNAEYDLVGEFYEYCE